MINSAKYVVKTAMEHMPGPTRKVYDRFYHDLPFLEQRYPKAISETEGYFRRFVSDFAPRIEGRIELLSDPAMMTGVTEALYIIDNLHRSLRVEGDVCEFGIARGATSAVLANEIRQSGRKLWLYDSFEGLSEPTEKDVLIDDLLNLGDMSKYGGTIAHPAMSVRNRLERISFPKERLRIVPGWVEELRQTRDLPEKVCFAYADLDLYAPIKIVLELLDARLPAGASVVIDDYGYFSSGVQTAVDEFFSEHGQAYERQLPVRFSEDQDCFVILRKL